ncbi:WecD Histone acetyltransferase HPA2 and related acetyltransferases [Flavobacteriaceae bacterium]
MLFETYTIEIKVILFCIFDSVKQDTNYMIQIRKATLKDLTILLEFEQGIISTERPYDTTLKEGNINYYNIEKMISAKDVEVVVAVIDDQVIGSGYARIEEAKPYLNHKLYAYLGFMFTHPDHRGKGVNALIIETLKNWIIAHNIFEMRLDVYNNNTSAIKAYEKIGFKKHLINMRVGL